MRVFVTGVLFFISLWAEAQKQEMVGVNQAWQAAEAVRQAGHGFFNQKQFKEALGKYRESLILFTQVGDSSRMAKCYNNIGNAQLMLGHNPEAVTAFYKAIDINKRLNNYKALVANYINLAAYYNAQQEFDQALKYYLEAKKEIEKAGDLADIVYIYIGLADILANKDYKNNDYNLAGQYYLKAIAKYQQTNDSLQLAVVYNNLGVLLYTKNKYDSSLMYYGKSVALKEALGDERGQIVALLNMGKIYMDQGNYGLALTYFEKGAQLALVYQDKVNYYHHLSNILKCQIKLGNLAIADSLFPIYNSLSDSIYNQEKAKTLKELEVLYETQKIGNDLQEQIKQTEAKTKLSYWYLAFAIGAILLLLVTILFFTQRQRFLQQLRSNELERLKKEQQLREMEALIKGQEAERNRIAQDLHDSVGARLSAIRLHALSNGQASEVLIQLIDACTSETRSISHNLSTSYLSKFGLENAINDLVELLNGTQSVKGKFTASNLPQGLPRKFEKAIYNIVVELVNNTIKHSKNPTFYIQIIAYEKDLTLNYEDFGQGFNMEEGRKNGMGLSNLYARAQSIQANFHIESSPGRGVQAVLQAPYPDVEQEVAG